MQVGMSSAGASKVVLADRRNSLEYLTELQRHSRELDLNPSAWMPWNYRETIEQIGI